MPEVRTDYVALFRAQLDKIDQLEATPGLVRDSAIQALDNASTQAIPHSARNILDNAKRSLENIGTLSLASNFQVIYAQMCILAVSNLEATLKTYFSNAANAYTQLSMDNPRLGQIRVSLKEILENELRFGGKVGSLIMEKAKPNFQDLKSIKDTFREYFDREISLNEEVEKQLCFYLEARHVLVHKGGVVDEKFLRATASRAANIKNLNQGDAIEINHDDWSKIKQSFTALVTEVTSRQS